jgi:hypothetical protein
MIKIYERILLGMQHPPVNHDYLNNKNLEGCDDGNRITGFLDFVHRLEF